MKSSFILALAASASLVSAFPTPPRVVKRNASVEINDEFVLNYALILELLESAFYQEGLGRFDEKAFADAGLAPFARGRFVQMRDHETAHVKVLQNELGAHAVQPCNYSFPFTDPKSFAALSVVLEGVGDAAYLGAVKSISDKPTATVAASILSMEGRHASWASSAVEKQQPWSGAFDTPLDFNQVFSLAAPFITSCPPSNPDLGLKVFPKLTLDPPAPAAGSEVTIKVEGISNSGPTFLALLSGLNTTFVEVMESTVKLPENLQGTVYAILSNNGTTLSDDGTIAGPFILDFPFSSSASNPQ